MRVIYEACDGKQFATAMECEKHEQAIRNLADSTLIDAVIECKQHGTCTQICKYYNEIYGECRMWDKRPDEWDFGGIENIKED